MRQAVSCQRMAHFAPEQCALQEPADDAGLEQRHAQVAKRPQREARRQPVHVTERRKEKLKGKIVTRTLPARHLGG